MLWRMLLISPMRFQDMDLEISWRHDQKVYLAINLCKNATAAGGYIIIIGNS